MSKRGSVGNKPGGGGAAQRHRSAALLHTQEKTDKKKQSPLSFSALVVLADSNAEGVLLKLKLLEKNYDYLHL